MSRKQSFAASPTILDGPQIWVKINHQFKCLLSLTVKQDYPRVTHEPVRTFSSLCQKVLTLFNDKDRLAESLHTSVGRRVLVQQASRFFQRSSTTASSETTTKPIFIRKRKEIGCKVSSYTKRLKTAQSLADSHSKVNYQSEQYLKFLAEPDTAPRDCRVMSFATNSIHALKQIHTDKYLIDPQITTAGRELSVGLITLALDLDETLVHCCNYDTNPKLPKLC